MERAYLYVHDLRSSGVVRNALTYAARIAQDRPTTLVAGYAQGMFAEEAAQGPFHFVALAGVERPMQRLQAAVRLRRWLRSQPSGLLLSLGNLGHTTVLVASRGHQRFKRVYRISNEVIRKDGMRHRLRLARLRMLIDDAARIVLVGRAFAEAEVFADAMRRGLAAEIPNGVDIERAQRLAAAPAPHPWLNEDVPVVLGIGRLRPQKNFDLLVRGVSEARKSKRLRLAILGGGTEEERQRLRTLAGGAGLGVDFLLAGETDNVFAWLARAAVFALPSRWEGSSMALLEALAVDVPVVASISAGDAPYVLGEGAYGLLFNGRDPRALADAILTQCSEAAVRPGKRACDFSLLATADAYADLVGELLS